MIYEPIIKAHQKKFKEAYNLIKDSEDQIFEKFVNYSELLQHQPDVFSSDLEFLDLVSSGEVKMQVWMALQLKLTVTL